MTIRHTAIGDSFNLREAASTIRLPRGMELVPLNLCRGADPGTDTARRAAESIAGEISTLFTKVLPRVARGEDIAAWAAGRGVEDPEAVSLSAAHTRFFGGSAIDVDLLRDGSFWVTNGARRVAVARSLGVTHMPARVTNVF